MWAEFLNGIVTRLKAKLPEKTQVVTAAELAEVPESRNKAPAALVLFDGYDPGEVIPNVHTIMQANLRFIVVAVTKSAVGAGDTHKASELASALSLDILHALLGWAPVAGKKANVLKLAQSGGPVFDGGFCYLPLGFTLAVTVRGDPA